ncbi:hypothetical protein EAH87_14650 [Sphingomonas koreensis]|nr:hypothetical protein EAH87_14650 [Sphingomonas koreensis]
MQFTKFTNWLHARDGRSFAKYQELWRWSVGNQESFGRANRDYFGPLSDAPFTRAVVGAGMIGAH